MADLRRLGRIFAEGDPHRPSDLNRIASSSATYQATIEREHEASGAHKPPYIPFAAARVIWDGEQQAYDVDTSSGVSSVSDLGSGRVRIELSRAAKTSRWGAIIWPDLIEIGEFYFSPIEIAGTKSSTQVDISLGEPSSFTIYCYDER